jgi:hypothetical protein
LAVESSLKKFATFEIIRRVQTAGVVAVELCIGSGWIVVIEASRDGTNEVRHPFAKHFIPTENERYKAAYHDSATDRIGA